MLKATDREYQRSFVLQHTTKQEGFNTRTSQTSPMDNIPKIF